MAWILCISGILLLDWEAWGVRLALVVLLVSTTVVCLRFSQTARRQQKRLGRLAADLRHHQGDGEGFS